MAKLIKATAAIPVLYNRDHQQQKHETVSFKWACRLVDELKQCSRSSVVLAPNCPHSSSRSSFAHQQITTTLSFPALGLARASIQIDSTRQQQRSSKHVSFHLAYRLQPLLVLPT